MKRPRRFQFQKKFYVYEHWRPDLDLPFWVGKGNDKRAYTFVRSKYYNNIVAKLARLGMCVEVRMVESGLPEHEAFALETVRIRYWRSRGVKLANATDGGEGASGYRHTKEAKVKISKAFKDKPLSKKHCKKISLAQKDKPRPPLSPEVAERASAAKSRAMKGKKNALGYRHTRAAKKKIAAAGIDRIFSDESRRKIGISKLGNTYNVGRPCKLKTRKKISVAQIGKPKFTEEQKRCMSEKRKGKPWTEARRLAQIKKLSLV